MDSPKPSSSRRFGGQLIGACETGSNRRNHTDKERYLFNEIEPDGYAEHVECHMNERRTHGFSRLPDRCQHGSDRGANVGAEYECYALLQGNQALAREDEARAKPPTGFGLVDLIETRRVSF